MKTKEQILAKIKELDQEIILLNDKMREAGYYTPIAKQHEKELDIINAFKSSLTWVLEN